MSRKFLGTWYTSFPERVWIEGPDGFYHSIPATREDHDRRRDFCLQMRRNHIELRGYDEEDEQETASKSDETKDDEGDEEETC